MMVKGCKPLVCAIIDEHRGTFETRRACSIAGHHIHGTTVKRKLFPDDERERYLHLFFSPVKMMKERCRLEDEIEQMQRLIERSVGQQITFGEPHTRFFDFLYDDEGRLVTALEKRRL